MKNKLIMCYGIQGSGKTTWSKEQVKNSNGKIKRVNKDEMRLLFDDGIWSSKNEKMIIKSRDLLIEFFLKEGYSVICDDTNLHPKHETRLKEIAELCNADFEMKKFEISLEEAIERDSLRTPRVGEKVIRQTWNQYFRKTEKYDGRGLPKACIFDVDGTIAIMNDRGPFDWMKVGRDLPNEPVINILKMYADKGYKILIVSGRDSICRNETKLWLEKQGITYDHLLMRKEGDCRKDAIIKREIFDKFIRGKYDIETVLDDRNQCVQLWRDELGLNTWQVNEGSF